MRWSYVAGMAALMVLLAGTDGHAAAAANGSGKVRLTPTVIRVPELIVAKSDAQQGPRLYMGKILPGTSASFGAGGTEAALNALGAQMMIVRSGPQFGLRANGGLLPMRQAGNGFWPVAVPLDAKRSYLLAFPMLAGATNAPQIHYRCGFVMRGTLGGQAICLYDDNLDAKFRIEDDCMRLGEASSAPTVFAPISKYIATPKGVYQIDSIAEDGSELAWSQYTGPAQKLTIGFASPEGEIHATFASQEMSFAAAANGRSSAAMSVVPGSYALSYGVVCAPRLQKVVAVVQAGKMQAVRVGMERPGQMKLGGPFTIEFAYKYENGKLEIDPGRFHVRGICGEEYTNVKYAVEPQIALVSGKQVLPVGKMKFG